MTVDYSEIGGSSRPQEGRSDIIQGTLDNLTNQELNTMNRVLDEHYNKKQRTILDKPLGEVINNTVNFLGHSFHSYSNKLLEAEFTQKIYTTEYTVLNTLQQHLVAISLFIRDDENIIYVGIIMIILSVLICFFNISRSYGHTDNTHLSTK
jgi:hypothetical protein